MFFIHAQQTKIFEPEKLNSNRVEAVLGPKWVNHPEGARLKKESDNFKRFLDAKHYFSKWLQSLPTQKTFDCV